MSAKNALKGFRTQTLYIIHRVFSTQDEHLQFCPEGNEDLDIRNREGKLIEVIQVKNYSETLTFSHLWDSSGKTSFILRSVNLCEKGEDPVLKVVSFGNISNELLKRQHPKYDSALKKFGISNKVIQFISDKIEFKKVEESTLEDEIKQFISQACIALDAELAISFLQSKIQFYSEQSIPFFKKDIIKFLNDVGAFVREREEFFKHYHSTIKIFPTSISGGKDLEVIRNQYRQGASAKFEHILADLDVVRESKMNQMSAKYSKVNTLIIHGASGQGKTSLAFRYIRSINQSLCYQVFIPDTHTEEMGQIQALLAMTKNLGLPILIYIDVEPGNFRITKLLSEFNTEKNVQVLVTIRSEDWNRTRGRNEGISFEEMELNFDESEAREIYRQLEIHQTDHQHLNFQDAWTRFGGKGPLLEFTYLVTQGKSLRDKLSSQVEKIISIENHPDEILKLLCIVSLADANGAKIDVQKVRDSGITTQLSKVISLFEREHLLKIIDQGQYLSGLHPVRSMILVDILVAHFVSDIGENFKLTASFINEPDIYLFLINCFHRHPEIEAHASEYLVPYVFKSTTGYRNCLLALIWLGVFKFSKKYSSDFRLLKEIDSSLIFILDHLDLTGLLDSSNLFGKSPILSGVLEKLREQQRLSGMDK